MMDLVNYRESLTQSMKSTIKSTALIGAILGQIVFGATADIIGRRKVFIATCSLVIVGALMSACAQDTSSFGIYSQLALWRFILGIGVGGEYPLSAAITSEGSRQQEQALNLALVFSMQGLGTVLCAVVLVIVTNVFPNDDYDIQWRIALAMGAFPMVCAFYFRWKLHEKSWSITNQVKTNIETEPNASSFQWSSTQICHGFNFIKHAIYENRWNLLGTAGSWFILDVVFYANGLFSGQVTKTMGVANTPRGEALASLMLQVIALPGYFCTVVFIRRIGLKRLQALGFFLTSLFFFLLAGYQAFLVKMPGLYIFLYGITFFFQNFGANATTYIIPSIIYSVEHRATCHGISSAAGKLGAVIGAQLFLSADDAFCKGGVCSDDSTTEQINAGLQMTFGLCGAFGIIGFLWTYYLVDDRIANNSDVEMYRHTLYSASTTHSNPSFSLLPTMPSPLHTTDDFDSEVDDSIAAHLQL